MKSTRIKTRKAIWFEYIKHFFENKIWLNSEFENILTDKFQIIQPDFSGSYVN